MNAIKSFLSLVCLVGVLNVHAQENTTVKPVKKGTKISKVNLEKRKASMNSTTVKPETKVEEKKVEDTKVSGQKSEIKSVNTTEKKDATSGQEKMKAVNRPVKVARK
jgi:hypothetical protein